MTELTLEQLRFAREIGATDRTIPPSDGKNTFYRNVRENSYEYFSNKTGAWEKSKGKPIFNTAPINFAPLNKDEQAEPQPSKMHASDFLQCGINHMRDREKTYDAAGGERSMGKTVAMFNSLYGLELTEQQGWAFMCLLKIVRTSQGAFRSDNYEDLAAYAGLMGESAQELGK